MTSPVDTLTSADVRELLTDKYILILGDSGMKFLLLSKYEEDFSLVIRSIYQDLIKTLEFRWFTQWRRTSYEGNKQFIDHRNKWREFSSKGEYHFYGDRLVHGGIRKGLTNGLDYEEVIFINQIRTIHSYIS